MNKYLLRSLVKGTIWELLSFLFIMIISFLVTRDWGTTTYISLVYMLIKIPFYVLNEIIWEKIKWGR